MKFVRPITVTSQMLAASNILENDYAEWSASVNYSLGDRVIAAAYGRIYESIAAGTGTNTNHIPWQDTASAYWVDIGAMNKWKMFDNAVSSQTQRVGVIDVTVTPETPVDSIAFINADATSAQITITDPVEGVVHDQSYALTSPGVVNNWYAYFFDDVMRKADLLVDGLPMYANASIRAQISSPGTTKIGALVFGRGKTIGATQYGAGVGIDDYSIKQQNDWGDYTIVERAFRKIGSFDVQIENYMVDFIQQLLAQYRAAPALYIGSDSYGATLLYGFFKSFDINLAYPSYSMCSISVEGLT